MTNSLDFEEVQESFKNSQELLNELTQKLVQLHEEYELTKKNTESLTAVSKSLDDYSTGAKKLISEVSDLLQENQKLVGTGQELLSSNSLVDIKKTVETIQSETTSIGDEIQVTIEYDGEEGVSPPLRLFVCSVQQEGCASGLACV